MRSKTDIDMLKKAVDSKFVPIYAESYSQVKDALQDKHGQRGWIGALAQTISGSETKSGKEYLAARRSIERYEKGQFKEMKKYSPEMSRVGKSLPPIGKKLPGNTITITVTGNQDRGTKHGGMIKGKRITVTFSGPDAYTFANNPTYGDIWFKYGVDPDDFEDGSGELEVTNVA